MKSRGRKAPEFERSRQTSSRTRHDADAARIFGDEGLVDMVILIGLYLTTCAITNAHLVSPFGSRRPRLTEVSRRRRAKSTAILTAELAGTFIPNAVPRCGGIDRVGHQQPPSLLQPQQLLI